MFVRCETCGKLFWKRKSYLGKVNHHYCDRKCWGKARQKRYTVYNNRTDMPVIVCGTVEECAKAMGISKEHFYSRRSHSNKGDETKWTIIDEGFDDAAEAE